MYFFIMSMVDDVLLNFYPLPEKKSEMMCEIYFVMDVDYRDGMHSNRRQYL